MKSFRFSFDPFREPFSCCRIDVLAEQLTVSASIIPSFYYPRGAIFSQSFRLGTNINGDAITAALNNGVLTIRMPYKAPKPTGGARRLVIHGPASSPPLHKVPASLPKAVPIPVPSAVEKPNIAEPVAPPGTPTAAAAHEEEHLDQDNNEIHHQEEEEHVFDIEVEVPREQEEQNLRTVLINLLLLRRLCRRWLAKKRQLHGLPLIKSIPRGKKTRRMALLKSAKSELDTYYLALRPSSFFFNIFLLFDLPSPPSAFSGTLFLFNIFPSNRD